MNVKLTLQKSGDVLNFSDMSMEEVRELIKMLACERVESHLALKLDTPFETPFKRTRKRRHGKRQSRNTRFFSACKPYTEADKDDLIDAIKDGKSWRKISLSTGRTIRALKCTFRRVQKERNLPNEKILRLGS